MDKNIAIIDYKDELAKDMVTMWENSVDGWNGEKWEQSEKSIIDMETNSSHLQLSLARLDELIVGYCKLSVDHQDTGALYIDLLNVRDDYHGKKVGKTLVKNAVEKTIDLKWPRVDLHTWEGNLKAIPLYKKCGFFWEKRENTTHLINLIPTIMQTPLLEDYFKKADWYNDSTREITVEHDIKDVNGFNVWTYSWDKDGDILEVDFTRRGRGIRRIENNDFSITTNIEDWELVFGQSYEIEYEIINKSGKELNIDLKGLDDGSITFNFEKSISVKDKSVIKGEFTLNPISKEQLEFKTHPGVTTEISVNGKSATFKTGIKNEFPLLMQLKHDSLEHKRSFSGREGTVYLDIQNNFKTDAKFSFTLPSTDTLTFTEKETTVELKAGKKKSIPLTYICESNCFYAPEVIIKGETEGKNIEFLIQLNETFRTGFGSYYGESNSFLEIGLGNYTLNINKDYNNNLMFSDGSKFDNEWKFLPPKLGKPFNPEFEHKSYDSFCVEEGNGWIKLILNYSSDSYKSIVVKRYFKLYQNGCLDRWFEVINDSNVTSPELFVGDETWNIWQSMVFPYKDKIILLDEDNTYFLEDWDTNKINENWLVFRGKNFNREITWENSLTLSYLGHRLGLTSNLGRIPAKESITTGKITISCDSFTDIHSFREFALKKKVEKMTLTPGMEFEINNGNPFCKGDTTLSLNIHSVYENKGTVELEIESNGEMFKDKLEKGNRIDFTTSLKPGVYNSTLNFIQEENTKKMKKTLFSLSEDEVLLDKKNDVLTVDNGVVKMSSSSKYAPSIFSLQYNGDELLDTPYPEKVQKSWWNPWCGGLISFPEEMQSLNSLLAEKVITEFAQKVDSKGNRWSGIKITVDIKENLDYEGLKFSQYYLVLPGIPVIAQYCEFLQDEVFNPRFDFQCNFFFKGKKSNKDISVDYNNYTNVPTRFNSGIEAIGTNAKSDLKLIDKSIDREINFYCDKEDFKGFYVNPDVSLIWFNTTSSALGGEIGKTKPGFIIIDQKGLNDEILSDLDNITF